MPKAYYVTTPLYYVNAAPHIGHSYTTVAVDVLARYHRLKGEDVFFLTGTDEHGEKIAQAAAAAGLSPKAFADRASGTFKSLWPLLGIDGYTRFIRTTDPDHEATVQAVLERLKPRLKHGTYRFWYCVPCETSFGLGEIEAAAPVCLNCRRPVTQIEEEDFFLALEPHRAWLREIIESERMRILPVERRHEVLGMLTQPLPDLCITRPRARVSWGIDVPFSRDHVTYVWFDALLNYISALGWPSDPRLARYWNEAGAVHLIGKDIIRHHALYWPIILRVLDLRPPAMVFAHGWWKMGEQKMSKSLGNIVDPTIVIGQLLKGQPFAADVYRYFLLREVPFGGDGAFSEEALRKRLQDDLADDLGNLVHRTHAMIERYCASVMPQAGPVGCAVDDEPLRQSALGLTQHVETALQTLDFSIALEVIFRVVSDANRYIETTAPWQLAKTTPERVPTVLSVLVEVIRLVARALEPFMPNAAQAIRAQLGLGPGQPLGPRRVLFPKNSR